MKKFSSNLCGYIKLENPRSGNLYAVSRHDWHSFLDIHRNRVNTDVPSYIIVIRLQKNAQGNYDATKEFEMINKAFLRGTFTEEFTICCQ